MELIFASHNHYKFNEIKNLFPGGFSMKCLSDISFLEEIPETSLTIEGNAIQKVEYLFNKTGLNCFSDDTGLIVNALNGEPGVYSARYAGPQKNDSDNIELLLKNLEGINDRTAYFKTVIALNISGETFIFEGAIHGQIAREKLGNNGFGYDPIFIPNHSNKSFAQMKIEEKKSLSHRSIALQKLIAFLQESKF